MPWLSYVHMIEKQQEEFEIRLLFFCNLESSVILLLLLPVVLPLFAICYFFVIKSVIFLSCGEFAYFPAIFQRDHQAGSTAKKNKRGNNRKKRAKHPVILLLFFNNRKNNRVFCCSDIELRGRRLRAARSLEINF